MSTVTQLTATPWTVTHQTPPSMGFFQARVLEWVAIFSRGIFPTQGSNPNLPHCRQILYCLNRKPHIHPQIDWVLLLFQKSNIRECKERGNFSLFLSFGTQAL